MRRKILIGGIAVAILICCVLISVSAGQESVTVKTGFVFCNGCYVESPYEIRLAGNVITINGNVVYKPRKKTPPAEIPTDAEDPGVPSWINKDTTLFELVSDGKGQPRGVPYMKWHYLIRANSSQNATVKMLKYLESLPCVKSVRLDTPISDTYYSSFLLTSHDGKKFGMIFDARDQKINEELENLQKPQKAEDPGTPAWINKDTSLFKLASDDKNPQAAGVVYKKWDYLVQNNPAPEAVKKLAQYVKSLPCVAGVGIGSPVNRRYFAFLTVTSRDGQKLGMNFASRQERLNSIENDMAARKNEANPETEKTWAKRQFEYIQNRLNSHDAIFCYREHISIVEGVEKFGSQFALAEKILSSDKTDKEKEKLIRLIGLSPGADILVKNYKPSKQLDNRLGKLPKATDITPMTIEELEKMRGNK